MIEQNISLLPFNTFRLDVRAEKFARVASADELAALVAAEGKPSLVLGGGSNMLLTRDLRGLVIRNEITGIGEVSEDDRHVYVRVGAGESWHPFVRYAVERGWAGIENLSLIPGSVGAAPIQNIGAYGVELKEVFQELEAFDLEDQKVYTLSANDCAFGYRDSVFKHAYRNRFVILTVTLRLSKQPVFHTNYGAIRQELDAMGVHALSIDAISQAVMRIRRSKLPDPAVIGNAGSFFKNPVVDAGKFAQLKADYPAIAAYPAANGAQKLAAGWLVEQAGWKGYRRGDAGVHPLQALVLVNYGRATGQEIYELSSAILESVEKKFGVTLEREVNVI